jgi:hypothetical protein
MTNKDKFYAHDRLEVSTEWPTGYDIAIFDRYDYSTLGMSIAQAKQLVQSLAIAIAEYYNEVSAYEAKMKAYPNDTEGSESISK